MKHAIPLSIVTSATIAACFGAGPTPSSPSAATVVFEVTPGSTTGQCVSHYVGDVGFADDSGFAVVMAYSPTTCGGDNAPSENLAVMQFAKDGGSATMIGSAGVSQTGGSRAPVPRLFAAGSTAIWAYLASGSNTTVAIDPLGLTIAQPSTGGSSFGAQALVGVGSEVFVLTSVLAQGHDDPNDPDYLCCGNSSSSSGTADQGQIAKFTADGSGGTTAIGSQIQLACHNSNHCMAATPDAVFWFELAGTATQVATIPTTGTAASSRFADLASMPSLTAPVGIAASGTTIAWAASVDYDVATASQTGCAISVADAANPSSVTTILATSQFSCMDVAVDATSVYFAIVTVSDGDSNNGGTQSLVVHGSGIGRVPIAGGDLESLDLGFVATDGGPRRIYLDATDLFAVDPQVIGKIAKSALDGRHDFTP